MQKELKQKNKKNLTHKILKNEPIIKIKIREKKRIKKIKIKAQKRKKLKKIKIIKLKKENLLGIKKKTIKTKNLGISRINR